MSLHPVREFVIDCEETEALRVRSPSEAGIRVPFGRVTAGDVTGTWSARRDESRPSSLPNNPLFDSGIIFIPLGGVVAQEPRKPGGQATACDVTRAQKSGDNERLRLRPAGARGNRKIVARFDSRPIGHMELQRPIVHLRRNGRATVQRSTFDVRVQLLNFSNNAWKTIAQLEVTTNETSFSVEAPAAVLAEKDGMKLRLQIQRIAGRGRWEFEIDALEFSE